jgi:predicted TIM-barrel fold metal-dependent hydrolase
MTIDVHTHAFPEAVAGRAIEALESDARQYGITACGDGTLSCLKKSMRDSGVSYSVVLPVATHPGQVPSINTFAIEQHLPESGIIFFGALHPEYPGWEQEIRRLKQAGIRGIKLHGEFQRFSIDCPEMLPVYQCLAQNDMIVMQHMGDDLFAGCTEMASPSALEKVMQSVPGLKVIAAHGGGFRRWNEFLDCLAGHPDVWVDLAFLPGYLPDDIRDRLLSDHGSHRILLGSDYPWVSQAAVIKYVRDWKVPLEVEEAVLGKNAAHLLQL